MDRKRQDELIQVLADACEELGWCIVVPGIEGDTEKIDGLIIGTEEFAYQIIGAMDPSLHDQIEVFTKDKSSDSEGMKELPAPPTKKKVTVH